MPYKDQARRNQATYDSWKRHPERRKAVARKRYFKKREEGHWAGKHLKRKYGLTLEDYAWMLQKQDGLCLVCGNLPTKRGLVVDHCHTTGKIRGLLCSPCNSFLGFYEKPGMVQKVEAYLGN